MSYGLVPPTCNALCDCLSYKIKCPFSANKTWKISIIFISKNKIVQLVCVVQFVCGRLTIMNKQDFFFMKTDSLYSAADKEFYPTLYNGCNNLSMLGFKFINLSEKGPMEMCIWVSELGYNWFSQWLVACLAPSHYWIKTDFFLIGSSFSNTSTTILSYFY